MAQDEPHTEEVEMLVEHKPAEPVAHAAEDTELTLEGDAPPVIPRIEHKWRFRDGKFKNLRGQWLYYCSYFPKETVKDKEPLKLRGVVLFLHGIGEYARRFTHMYDVLLSNGFGVIAYDMISHGRSDDDDEGERAHALAFQHFVDDTNVFVTFAKQKIFPEVLGSNGSTAPLPPLVFMGMSYGTLVGLHTVLSEKHAFQGVVLAAPALGVEWTLGLQIQRLLMFPISKLLPRIRVTEGVNYEYLSRNPEFRANFMADPLIVTANFTARMATETLDAMEKVQNDTRIVDSESAFCKLPLLIVQGTSDKVTSVALAEEFFQRVGSTDKHFEKFDGLYHCIFNEPEKDAVTEHISTWLVDRFPLEA